MDVFGAEPPLHSLSRRRTNSNPVVDPQSIPDDGGDYCRICRGEATLQQPLFFPCKCSGSIKYVHQECLVEWLKHSQKKYCELCKTQFHFTKLYDESMPDVIPLPEFTRRAAFHAAKSLSRWARYIFVGLVWTICLPWSIRQIWRGLFWLADGSWMSEEYIRHMSVNNSSQSGTVANTTESPTLFMRDHGKTTLIHVAWSLLTGFFYLVLDSDPAVKAVRLAFEWSYNTSTANSTGASESILRREPSLLSDVRILQRLTPSPILNTVAMDILEGQLICLLLIGGFILVFLIREWVIGQQPLVNVPDADQPDPAPVAAQANDEQPNVPGRRRRPLRRAGPEVQVVDNPEPQRVRRALTEDNILVATSAMVERPVTSGRSMSLDATMAETPDEMMSTVVIDSATTFDAQVEELESPPLTRGALGNVVDIQRTIEENPQLNIEPVTDSIGSPIEMPTHHNSGLGEESTNDANSIIDHASLGPGPVLNEVEEAILIPMKPVDSASASAPFQSSIVSHEIDGTSVTTEESHSSPVRTPSSSIDPPEMGNPDGSDIITQNTAEAHIAEPQSFLDKLTAWLWNVDIDDVPGAPVTGADTIEIVRDLAAEPPFIPVQALQNDGPNIEPLPVRPAAANNPQENPWPAANLNLNDVNAADDAEDFDGLLELIGMEGPIGGMIQNVLFSLFLIIIILCANIWCPYIWGKIALMLIAHPFVVFLKVPLFLLTKGADMIADAVFVAIGLFGLLLAYAARAGKMGLGLLWSKINDYDTRVIEDYTLKLSHSSGARLEKTFTSMFVGMRPDLPTFSMQSHHVLRVFKQTISATFQSLSAKVLNNRLASSTDAWTLREITFTLFSILKSIVLLPFNSVEMLRQLTMSFARLSDGLKPLSFSNSEDVDYSLIHWDAQDKIIAVILGYAFLTLLGWGYLKVLHLFRGLRRDQKVEGFLADKLRQIGGVMKVIVIIGVEMIVFPFYCGLLLDIAVLPLFGGASVQSRYDFLVNAPVTSIFIHWFIGTCYMFHFALFVSICRKILRKGVLYFIRDPDDPTFHPVRDVLERPVATQLGKIAFSALVYGGLVMVCLGGVVWILSGISGVLPMRWTTSEPRLAFPIDVVFYNFLLPFLIRKAELVKKVTAVYGWWFRGCASRLRLSHFLMGTEREEEKLARQQNGWSMLFSRNPSTGALGDVETVPALDGSYVRAPASDSVRIPKGQKVFVEVDENNNRVDGQPDNDTGLHGKNDERFSKIYIPPHFRARVVTFIALLWLFTASMGVMCTIGPLLLGRLIIKVTTRTQFASNDLYAFTIGSHVAIIVGFAGHYLRNNGRSIREQVQSRLGDLRNYLPEAYTKTKYACGLLYLVIVVGVILPFLISLLMELYIHVPLFAYLSIHRPVVTDPEKQIGRQPVPSIFVLQTWTLGLMYLRLGIRMAVNHPHRETRLSTAIRAITRNGWRHPDVGLATRAFIMPVIFLIVTLIFSPLGIAKAFLSIVRIEDERFQRDVYRFAYPAFMTALWAIYALFAMQRQLARWRMLIRDEIYLRGERLHNFQDPNPKKTKPLPSDGKGKEKAE